MKRIANLIIATLLTLCTLLCLASIALWPRTIHTRDFIAFHASSGKIYLLSTRPNGLEFDYIRVAPVVSQGIVAAVVQTMPFMHEGFSAGSYRWRERKTITVPPSKIVDRYATVSVGEMTLTLTMPDWQPPVHYALGFGYVFDANSMLPGEISSASATIPFWLLILPGIYPLLKLRTALRQRHRRRNNLCLNCGFDLRASNEICPECGVANSFHSLRAS